MKKLAIIGASYLQKPLIQKAKDMGIETHVFAWAVNDVGEQSADYFYPISIIEKDAILEKCREIDIDGICSIASDLAMITVNYVADQLHLTGNSIKCMQMSTNKYLMRNAFEKNGDPSPKYILISSAEDLNTHCLRYPVIVKPIDRSGSRGVTKVQSREHLDDAVVAAMAQGFDKNVLVEEFVVGQEYSAECISVQGKHYFMALTQKYTTGAPHFIETGHLQPAPVSNNIRSRVEDIVFHALDSLCITNGASHSELKINTKGEIKLIEIGGRMGGDCIGSDLVKLSTGIDYVKAVIQIALGEFPDLTSYKKSGAAAVHYILCEEDFVILNKLKSEHPEYIIREEIFKNTDEIVTDSSNRYGMFLMHTLNYEDLQKYLPKLRE